MHNNSIFKTPKISVIMSVFNGAEFLRDALNSVFAQKDVSLQIICIDDGSSDASNLILDEYVKKHSNMLVISRINKGLAASRNLGIMLASGEYIQFLDCDDTLTEDACSKLYSFASSNNLDICSFSGFNINNGKREDNPYWSFNDIPQEFIKVPFSYTQLNEKVLNLPVSSCLSIYKREFLDRVGNRFPEGLIFEDNVFFLNALFHSDKIGIFNEKLYLRKLHSEQISSRNDASLFDIFSIKKICYKLIMRYLGRPIALQYAKAQLNHMNYLGKQISETYKEQFHQDIIKYITSCLNYHDLENEIDYKNEKSSPISIKFHKK